MRTTTQTLNRQQTNHLNRLYEACGTAENFSKSIARQERLDKYMEHLMEQGIDSQDIINALS